MSIAQKASGVHLVQVRTPDGDIHDISRLCACGLRRATRIATTLAGWLPVDEWEVASRFVPDGVRKIRKELLRDIGDAALDGCQIEIVRQTDNPIGNGYEVVAVFHVGAVVPPLLKMIRSESQDTAWRADSGHTPNGPHITNNDTVEIFPHQRVNYTVENLDR